MWQILDMSVNSDEKWISHKAEFSYCKELQIQLHLAIDGTTLIVDEVVTYVDFLSYVVDSLIVTAFDDDALVNGSVSSL